MYLQWIMKLCNKWRCSFTFHVFHWSSFILSLQNIIVVHSLSCLTLCHSVNYSMPSFPAFHYLPEFAQIHVHWIMMPSTHLILCHPLLLLPAVFPSIRKVTFFSELALHTRWLKYWSSNFNISPSNEYSFSLFFKGNIARSIFIVQSVKYIPEILTCKVLIFVNVNLDFLFASKFMWDYFCSFPIVYLS